VSRIRTTYLEEEKRNEFDGKAINDLLFDKKVTLAIEGLEPSFDKKLRQRIPKKNALAIAEYINATIREINMSSGYRRVSIHTLANLSKFHSHKVSFKEMTREDVLLYLDSLRRPEGLDPLHKWIGTYNLKKTIVVKFFKWLYYPGIGLTKRPKPVVVENIAAKAKRTVNL
jgi:hypothetical protein